MYNIGFLYEFTGHVYKHTCGQKCTACHLCTSLFFWKFAVACKNIFETIKYKEMRFDISIVYQGYYFIGHKAVSSNGKSMKFESCFKF